MCGAWIVDQSKGDFIVLTCYRSPGSNFKFFCDCIIKVMDYVYGPERQIMLLGDFNVDRVRDTDDCLALGDILGSYNIINIVDSPTRENRILDHAYTNCVSAECTINEVFFSDHRAIKIGLQNQLFKEEGLY